MSREWENPNVEYRNPKEARLPKHECRKTFHPVAPTMGLSRWQLMRRGRQNLYRLWPATKRKRLECVGSFSWLFLSVRKILLCCGFRNYRRLMEEGSIELVAK